MQLKTNRPWTQILLASFLCWALLAPIAIPLLAQPAQDDGSQSEQDPSTPTQDPESPDPNTSPTSSEEDFFELDDTLSDSGNCPPSTMTKILVGVIALALITVCYFLIVHIVERRYIQQDRSASLGRHVGFSYSIFITVVGTLLVYQGLTKCPWSSLWLGALIGGGIWLVHLLYLWVVVRND